MREKVANLLQALDIPYRQVEHPPVFSVAEAMEHVQNKLPLKNLLLKEEKGDKLFLVVMAGEERLPTKQLARDLEAKKLQFAKPDLLLEKLGVTPGSVSLFSVLHPGSHDVHVVVDAAVIHEPELGFHPSDNTQTIFIPGSAVEQILATTGHAYSIKQLY